MIDSNWFTPTDPQLFFSRNDLQDPRLGESAVPISESFNELKLKTILMSFLLLDTLTMRAFLKMEDAPGLLKLPFLKSENIFIK